MNTLRLLRNIVGKLLCFAYFGLTSLFASCIIFPLIHVCVWKKKRRRNAKIAIVRAHFSFFIGLLFLLARYKIDATALQSYKDLRSTLVVANHPTLIDIVVLIAAIPHPDCIVAGKLFHNFWVKKIVGELFVSAAAHTDVLLTRCLQSLHEGNNMIIFPEGTRTGQRAAGHVLKRGAAHIALRAPADILPIHIKTENLVGLGKHDSLLKVHVHGYAKLTLKPHSLIAIHSFIGEPFSQAAKTVTEVIQNTIFSEAQSETQRRYTKRD